MFRILILILLASTLYGCTSQNQGGTHSPTNSTANSSPVNTTHFTEEQKREIAKEATMVTYYRAPKKAKQKLQEDPNNVPALVGLGQWYLRTDLNLSIQYSRKALKIEPKCETAKQNLLVAYMKLGRKADARKLAEELKDSQFSKSVAESVLKKLDR